MIVSKLEDVRFSNKIRSRFLVTVRSLLRAIEYIPSYSDEPEFLQTTLRVDWITIELQ